MRRLIYLSKATKTVESEDLDNILMASRENNGMVGVTGLLLYADGMFIQCLEGTGQAVEKTLERISRDDRHEHIETLVDEEVSERLFPNWEMGFHPSLTKMQRMNLVDIRTKANEHTGNGKVDAALTMFFVNLKDPNVAA
jgi:hypothetical protein